MKKKITAFAGLLLLTYIIGCVKTGQQSYSCSGPSAASDSSTLLAFAKSDTITPVADPSWLYYQIINQGSGATPTGKSKVTVSYIGQLMNGYIFDSTAFYSPRTMELDSLIQGWQIGLPKIQSGGRIKLLVPSALAFGCLGTVAIPSNAPLYFDITLLNVQ